MRRGLGAGEPGEHVQGTGPHLVGEGSRLHQTPDVRPGAVHVAGRHLHVDPGRSQPGPGHGRPAETYRLDVERVDRGLHGRERRTGADQGAEHHVAADAGRRVEPRDAVVSGHARTSARRATRAAKTPAPKPLSMLQTVTPGAQELSIASSAARPPYDVP